MIDTNHIIPVQMFKTEQAAIVQELQSRGSTAKFVEWGSGGSTILWYTNLRDQQQLISIENDPVWAKIVQTEVDQQRARGINRSFEYHVYETDNDGATFTPENSYYQNYVSGPEGIWDADIYLVDGRVRQWCGRNIFEHAENRDAVVFCHDYAYNEGSYAPLLDLYARHEIITTAYNSDPTDPGLRHYTADNQPKLLKLWLR
jgi:hypothetical protein